MHEERHAEDRKDEHHQEEQQANVEQRRQRHRQCEQQRAYALRALHQAQHTTHFRHAHHTQQCRRDEVFLDNIAKYETCALSIVLASLTDVCEEIWDY